MINRRAFLAGAAFAAAPSRARAAAPQRPETFTEWIQLSRADRDAALPLTVDRILKADASIRAWVQVQPEPPTGRGPLDGIPFGGKDETQGLRGPRHAV